MNSEYSDRWSRGLGVAEGARRSRALPGSTRCLALAPELFEVDAFGEACEIADGWVSSDLENKAWLARANCLEFAIDIECAGEAA
jgi:ferredoxin